MIQMNLFKKQKQTHRELWLPRGNDGGKGYGAWDQHVHTAVFKMDNQKGPTAQHRKLWSMLCDSLDGRGVWERTDTCTYMAESLCCVPETITTLLMSCNHSSLMSNSLWPHGLWPARLFCPWNSPSKNTRVGSHSLLQGDLPDPGIKPESPTLQADSLLSEPPEKSLYKIKR